MWKTLGHDKAVSSLTRAVGEGRIAHAYIIVGPPSVGKMVLAMDMARALNCDQDAPPCGACKQCTRITNALHPDVRVVERELDDRGRRRTVIRIEQVREIQREASLKPYEGASRVYIFDGADSFQEAGANSLLKTLEEPPDQVVLILLASSAEAIMPTILSRCRRIDLRPVAPKLIAEHLTQHHGSDPEKADEIARLSAGQIGWAIRAVDEPELLERIGQQTDAIEQAVQSGLESRLEYAAQLATRFTRDRTDAFAELGLWLGWWRDVMMISEKTPQLVRNTSRMAALQAVADRLDERRVADVVRAVGRTIELLERNVNPRLAIEELMLAIPMPQPARQ
ncbi:MAG: DNA polymerase III subunit delta' [SAR202 cluster bacterium]|jgi:DNA polymerase-3 subunit delta'|nr:DNA polymerase III subunit delta' [SAR202 cluster bacterium]MDP6300495.1 DNA polymerase III subunit delta' [SAR202 cluster bacterium]MDP7102820.1 DNA polymerase III subunit delta' [SAR202 cluster bacterium]MDP7224301.1 DNA polymerase III subunit delta' [SAR202 cluster bacterium]MDP7413950.1 DNA polymerase III subunit delta' [SAR202 cluster bacterium]